MQCSILLISVQKELSQQHHYDMISHQKVSSSPVPLPDTLTPTTVDLRAYPHTLVTGLTCIKYSCTYGRSRRCMRIPIGSSLWQASMPWAHYPGLTLLLDASHTSRSERSDRDRRGSCSTLTSLPSTFLHFQCVCRLDIGTSTYLNMWDYL